MYTIERFGTTTLPIYRPRTDVGTSGSKLLVTDLPGGGVFDGLGDDDAPPARTTIPKRCTIVGATDDAADTEFQTLRALRGKRDRLYRRRADGDVEWCYARLEKIDSERVASNLTHLNIAMLFLMLSPIWYGAEHGVPWFLDAGEFLDTGLAFDTDDTFTLSTSPKTCIVNNGGDKPVSNCILTITAGSAAITALTIAIAGISEFDYTGTIAIGKALVVDCGALTVENDGADDYAHFALDASNHKIDDWLRLAAGNNSVVVTRTGGDVDSTILFSFSDGRA